MPGGRRVTLPKKQGEIVTMPFDFASNLQLGETLLTAEVTASVYSGTDINPSAIIYGNETIVGGRVLQRISVGTVGVTYGIMCRVTTSEGQILDQTQFCVIIPGLT